MANMCQDSLSEIEDFICAQ